jgi:hypothetical protein
VFQVVKTCTVRFFLKLSRSNLHLCEYIFVPKKMFHDNVRKIKTLKNMFSFIRVHTYLCMYVCTTIRMDNVGRLVASATDSCSFSLGVFII